MKVRDQLSRELEQAPESLVEEILDFCLFLKQRQQAKVNNQATKTKTNGILDLLERVKEIQAQVPTEEWNKLPHDLTFSRLFRSKNNISEKLLR